MEAAHPAHVMAAAQLITIAIVMIAVIALDLRRESKERRWWKK